MEEWYWHCAVDCLGGRSREGWVYRREKYIVLLVVAVSGEKSHQHHLDQAKAKSAAHRSKSIPTSFSQYPQAIHDFARSNHSSQTSIKMLEGTAVQLYIIRRRVTRGTATISSSSTSSPPSSSASSNASTKS